MWNPSTKAFPANPSNLDKFLPTIVVLLKNIVDSMVEFDDAVVDSSSDVHRFSQATRVHNALVDMNTIMASVLYDFRLVHARTILDNELGF